MSAGADLAAHVVGGQAANAASPDLGTLTRIERDRDAAFARYRRDRDSLSLDVAMAQLDTEETTGRRCRG